MLQLFQMEFAYSQTMQIILACMSFCCTFLCHYVISTLILTLYGDTVSPCRRMMFSFFTGVILNDVWVYGVYILGGMASFSPIVFALVAVPNPFMALLYYYFGVKTLRLSPIRSIRIMCHTYLYVMAYKSIIYFVNYAFFNQPLDVPYNYMIDACSLLIDTAITLIIAWATIKFVRNKRFTIDFRDTMSIKSIPAELARSFVLATISYTVFVLPRLDSHGNHILGYSSAVISTVLIFLLSLLWDVYRVTETKRANKAAYVNALVKSTDDFRTFRHDFKNVLQTYGGYVTLNDMDGLRKYHESVVSKSLSADLRFELTRRMEECPRKVSLLLEKLAYAEQLGVDFQMTTLGDLYTTNDMLDDSYRCMSCLLDNAIESAAESERKMVLYSREVKANGNALIVITNSTRDDVLLDKCCEPGFTTKPNHKGLGLPTVRKIIDKIPYCTLNMTYYQHEFTVYIETCIGDELKLLNTPEVSIKMPSPETDSFVYLTDTSMNTDLALDFSILKLLIVDDNAFLIDTVKKYLEGLHATVDTAENGLAGLKLYQSDPDRYDLIFLDITMPIMNGIEAAKHIRETDHPSAKTIPLIAITGNLLPDPSKMHLFDGILYKPFDFSKLETLIRQYVRK